MTATEVQNQIPVQETKELTPPSTKRGLSWPGRIMTQAYVWSRTHKGPVAGIVGGLIGAGLAVATISGAKNGGGGPSPDQVDQIIKSYKDVNNIP